MTDQTMPVMPTMPETDENKNDDVSGNAFVSSPLDGEVSQDASPSSKEGLTVPSHKEDKPEYIVPGGIDSKVDIPLVPIEGIKVVALRKGFYGQQRKNKDDKFTVKRFEKLGEWMKCEDPAIERKRIKFFKDKKARK